MPSRIGTMVGVTFIIVAVGCGALASADSGNGVASLPTVSPPPVSVPGGGNASGGDGTDEGDVAGGGNQSDVCYAEVRARELWRDPVTMEMSETPQEGWERAYISPSCSDGTCPPGMDMSEASCNGWFAEGAEPAPPTVDDLWPGAYDEAVSQIPLPIPAVAPPVVQGTLVNAPLWLAVEPPAPVTARAQVGAVWAQVDATFVGLTWDMGVPGTDDDVVECDDAGEIWDGFSPTEDPWQIPECGWNYERPSTPDNTGTENPWYDISVTAHWEIRLTGSDGRDVALDPIDVPIEFDYVVYEWQTVGTD